MENPNFLNLKYNKLSESREVELAVKKEKLLIEKPTLEEQEPVDSKNEAKIRSYLNRLKGVFDRQNPQEIENLRRILFDKFIIEENEIPESYFNSVKRKHRKEGHGDIEIPADYRHELAATIIGDQESSLAEWFDYLSSPDDKHDIWLKYHAFRSVLKMGRYDKEKKAFTQRSSDSISPYPELNREALAIILEDIDKFEQNKNAELDFTGRYDIEEQEKEKYKKFLADKNFAGLYALAIEAYNPIAKELLKITEGEWKKYPKGSDHLNLVDSISKYGTGWCLRGKDMAQRYLVRDKNDLYVYYSLNEKGEAVVPRVVMVVNNQGQIAEVRGVAVGENLDRYIKPVVDAKLSEPEFKEEGKKYLKKSSDMGRLTEIEDKINAKQELTRTDLIFLYEIDEEIEGFGYGGKRDPRIKEILDTRKSEEDALIIFQCSQNQIAKNSNEVSESTKAYIGLWNVEIFQKIKAYSNIEHLYESFPDKKIFLQAIKIIPALDYPHKAQENLDKENIYTSDWGRDILQKTEFSKEDKEYDLVRFSVAQLGFPNGATTEEIYKKAEDLGLELCPAEVGPLLRLQSKIKDWTLIAMDQITDRGGRPSIFRLDSYGDQLELRGIYAQPGKQWDSDYQFVFRFRKFAT